MSRTLAQLFSRKRTSLGRVRTNYNCRIRPAMLRLEDRTVPAVFMVTNTDDSGAGSLRQAVIDANAAAGADTVAFSSLFENPQTIGLTTGQMVISNAVSIQGPGSSLLTLNGGPVESFDNRHFEILSGAGTVQVSGMTLSHGYSLSGGAIKDGAYNDLQLVSLVFDSNKTSTVYSGSTNGGAVDVYGGFGKMTVIGCTFVNNQAPNAEDGGGALSAFNTDVYIERSTFTNNRAPKGRGGAVRLESGLFGSLSMNACTFSQNSSKIWGGAISAEGSAVISNSTFVANSATSFGGALACAGFTVIRNSTIKGNSIANGTGAGVWSINGLTLSSSVIAGNYVGFVATSDVSGSGTGDNNLIGSPNSISGTENLTGIDPKLGPLADNGGPTKTCMPMLGSPLINAGNNAAGLDTDQRGAGFLRVIDGLADIGAVELQTVQPPFVSLVLINNGTAQRSQVTSIAVTFSGVVNLPANATDAFELRRQTDNVLVGLTANVANGSRTVVTLTFGGTLSEAGSLADGRYTLTIDATKVFNANGQLDGNGDGTGGDNYVLVGDPATNKLFRYFGDADGNGTINSVDFTSLRTVFGLTGPSIFDSNGDNRTDADDFAAFRMRFGLMI